MAITNNPQVMLEAIQECGRDYANKIGCTEQSGIYNFLGSQPLSLIAVLIADKLKDKGYTIVPLGQSQTFKKRKTGEK